MVRKQVLQAHEHSGQSLLEKVKSKSNQKKLLSTFSKLHISLTPDQEHNALLTLLLSKPVVKHLKFKVGYLTVTLKGHFSFKMHNLWCISLCL